jgi:hypothetical protein
MPRDRPPDLLAQFVPRSTYRAGGSKSYATKACSTLSALSGLRGRIVPRAGSCVAGESSNKCVAEPSKRCWADEFPDWEIIGPPEIRASAAAAASRAVGGSWRLRI